MAHLHTTYRSNLFNAHAHESLQQEFSPLGHVTKPCAHPKIKTFKTQTKMHSPKIMLKLYDCQCGQVINEQALSVAQLPGSRQQTAQPPHKSQNNLGDSMAWRRNQFHPNFKSIVNQTPMSPRRSSSRRLCVLRQ